jgi:hypothetical protein
MTDKKFIYAGPSWAVMSFDIVQGDPSTCTSLLREWGLEDDAINVSQRGDNFDGQLEKILSLNSDLPIVYISCEPLQRFKEGQYSYIEEEHDMMYFRKDIHAKNMKTLRQLPNRVAVIGAHADITDSYTDVIDRSWQNFLFRQIGEPERYNWGADVLHRDWIISNNEFKDKRMPFVMSNQFTSWDKLIDAGLMCGTHVTTKGNKLYADYTYDKIKEFLDDNT